MKSDALRIALVLAGLAFMPVGAVEPSGQPRGNSLVLFSSLYPPVVIAQAPKTQPQTSPAAAGSATVERTIGVCQLIENPPIPALTAANVAAPAMAAWSYLTSVEKFKLSEDMSETAKTTLLDGAKHGELKVTPSGNYRYHPTTGYCWWKWATTRSRWSFTSKCYSVLRLAGGCMKTKTIAPKASSGRSR